MSQIKNSFNTNNLLETQIIKLLKEFQTIINQKWIYLNTEGFNYISKLFEIFENYVSLFREEESG